MRLIPSITASTLFITGQRDTVTHPHVQSLPFQRGLAARGVPTQHLSLPGEGHTITSERSRYFITLRTLHWAHAHWGTYEAGCALYEMSTDGSGRPVTTEAPPEDSTTTERLVSSSATIAGAQTALVLGLLLAVAR